MHATGRFQPPEAGSPGIGWEADHRWASGTGWDEKAARGGDLEQLLEQNIRFHTAMCALACDGRLTQTYRSLILQLRLCMAMNLRLRERIYGNLEENVDRHRVLLELAEAVDREGLLVAIAQHGDRSFIEHLEEFKLVTRGQPC